MDRKSHLFSIAWLAILGAFACKSAVHSSSSVKEFENDQVSTRNMAVVNFTYSFDDNTQKLLTRLPYAKDFKAINVTLESKAERILLTNRLVEAVPGNLIPINVKGDVMLVPRSEDGSSLTLYLDPYKLENKSGRIAWISSKNWKKITNFCNSGEYGFGGCHLRIGPEMVEVFASSPYGIFSPGEPPEKTAIINYAYDFDDFTKKFLSGIPEAGSFRAFNVTMGNGHDKILFLNQDVMPTPGTLVNLDTNKMVLATYYSEDGSSLTVYRGDRTTPKIGWIASKKPREIQSLCRQQFSCSMKFDWSSVKIQ